MRAFLLSLIPWYAGWFALLLLVYSYTGDWPNGWAIVSAFLTGVAWASRELA